MLRCRRSFRRPRRPDSSFLPSCSPLLCCVEFSSPSGPNSRVLRTCCQISVCERTRVLESGEMKLFVIKSLLLCRISVPVMPREMATPPLLLFARTGGYAGRNRGTRWSNPPGLSRLAGARPRDEQKGGLVKAISEHHWPVLRQSSQTLHVLLTGVIWKC
jgi:hypothetical protein